MSSKTLCYAASELKMLSAELNPTERLSKESVAGVAIERLAIAGLASTIEDDPKAGCRLRSKAESRMFTLGHASSFVYIRLKVWRLNWSNSTCS
jgi:hypothetical protein